MAHFELAATGFERSGNRRGLAKALGSQGEAYRHMIRWDEAMTCYQQAIAIDEEIGHEVQAARTRMNLGILCHEQGRHEEALALHMAVEPLFRRLGDRPHLARVYNNVGVFLAALGRWDEFQAAFDSAVSLHLEADDLPRAAHTLTNSAEHLLDQKLINEASDYLDRAYTLLDTLPSPPDYLLRDWELQSQRLETMLAAQPAN